MKSNFSFTLINRPYEDSLLHARQLNSKEDLLFDLGDTSRMPASLMLRVRFVFISHAHIDHFAGFAGFLRTILKNHGMRVDFFGPPGFTRNFEGALNAYTWNLIHGYDLKFWVHETDAQKVETTLFDSRNIFRPEKSLTRQMHEGIVLEGDLFRVKTQILDHHIPVLGFRIEEKDRFAVNTDALGTAGLSPGKWLGESKKLILEQAPGNTMIQTEKISLSLEEIRNRFFVLKSFSSYAYLTDFGFTDSNLIKAVELAKNVDTLFIESNFLHEDIKNALETRHLTAFQAGKIAGIAEAKRVKLFHFSQRYLKEKQFPEEKFYSQMEEGRRICKLL